MGNQNAYQEGLQICNQSHELVQQIVLSIIENPELANGITTEVFTDFLKQCYYEGVPENGERALCEAAYGKALQAKQSQAQPPPEEEAPAEGVPPVSPQELPAEEEAETEFIFIDETYPEDEPEPVPEVPTDVPFYETPAEPIPTEESMEYEIPAPESPVPDSTEEDVPFSIEPEEEFSIPEEEYQEEAGAYSTLSPYAQSLMQGDAGEEEEAEDVPYEYDDEAFADEYSYYEPEETEEEALLRQKRRKRRTIILTVVFSVLILIILWLLIGLLINTGVFPKIDLGYSWFNDHIFRAFFLTDY